MASPYDDRNPLEARRWLSDNPNPNAFAGNHFVGTQNALDFVEELYRLGATEILIDNIYEEDWRIKAEGGPYADSLTVALPDDIEKRAQLFKLINQESSPFDFDKLVDEGQSSVVLWWD